MITSKRETTLATAIAVAIALALLLICGAFHIDLSGLKYLQLDLTMRVTVPESALPQMRFGDPSGTLIWPASELFIWHSLHSGHLPLWDPHPGGGYSPIIAFDLGVLHPLRWIAAIGPRDLMPTAVIVLSLTLAALGTFLFARSLEMSRPASTLAALLFALGPATISYAHYTGMIVPLAHLPWILYFRRRFVPLALVLASLLMAGHPSIVLAVGGAAALFVIERSPRPLLRLLAAAVCAILIAAVALLPPLLAAHDLWSYKTASGEGLSFRPFPPRGWVLAIVSVVWDRLGYVFPDQPASYAYAGLPLIALIAMARKRAERAGAIAAIFFLIAVPGPWMAFLRHIPPISYMAPWYFSGCLAFWLAITGAMGFEELQRRSRIAAIALAIAASGLFALRTIRILEPVVLPPLAAQRALSPLRAAREPFRITGTLGAVHAPKLSTITGIDDMRYVAPFFTKRYERWWALVDPNAIKNAYTCVRITDRLDSPLVADFNIEYVLEARYPATDVFWTIPDPSQRDRFLSPRLSQFPIAFSNEWILIHAHPAKPRVHFAANPIVVKDLDAAVQALRANPALTVIESRGSVPQASGAAEVAYPDDAHAVVRTQSTNAGLVVLHDAYAAGWTAAIDGKRTDVMPVNVLSRGVVVPAGNHQVTFAYMPPGLAGGAAISLLTIAALLFLDFRGLLHRFSDRGSTALADHSGAG